jgi:hypothetical protein
MPGQGLARPEDDVGGRVEGHVVAIRQAKASPVADLFQKKLGEIGLDLIGTGAGQPKRHGCVGRVTLAGQPEGAEELDLLAVRRWVVRQAGGEIGRGHHRPHGVGAGGTDTDPEQIEQTDPARPAFVHSPHP